MQNADTTQFFGGIQIYILSTQYTEIVVCSSPSSSRSSSTLNFPFRVDTFFVVFLCHLDFRFVRFFRRFLAGNEQVVRIREGAEAYPSFYECFSIFQKKKISNNDYDFFLVNDYVCSCKLKYAVSTIHHDSKYRGTTDANRIFEPMCKQKL